MPTEAWLNGYDSYRAYQEWNLKAGINPYRVEEGTDFADWENGWRAAELEDQDRS